MIKFSRETLNLAESVGEFIQYWGFKKVHGQIWLLTFISKEPICAGTLVSNLGITKGLVSTAIKTLLEYNLIEELDIGDNRTKFYHAKSNFISVILDVLKGREVHLIEKTKMKLSLVQSINDPLIDSKRVKNLKNLIRLGDTLLKGIIGLKNIDLTSWKN